MPRPRKLREICSLPNNCRFGPLDYSENQNMYVTMTVDEYETIRLIDLDGYTQEECSAQMNVARTTVQSIYQEARKKIAEFIVNGKNLIIEGGEYKVCNGSRMSCHRRCGMRDCMKKINCRKENDKMIIAIPVETNSEKSQVCMSFGRTLFFALYDQDTKEYKILDNSAAASAGGAGILASQMLIDNGVTTVITPRLGQNAADVLKAGNIRILKSINGTAEDNIKAFQNGDLSDLTNIHAGFHGGNR